MSFINLMKHVPIDSGLTAVDADHLSDRGPDVLRVRRDRNSGAYVAAFGTQAALGGSILGALTSKTPRRAALLGALLGGAAGIASSASRRFYDVSDADLGTPVTHGQRRRAISKYKQGLRNGVDFGPRPERENTNYLLNAFIERRQAENPLGEGDFVIDRFRRPESLRGTAELLGATQDNPLGLISRLTGAEPGGHTWGLGSIAGDKYVVRDALTGAKVGKEERAASIGAMLRTLREEGAARRKAENALILR